MHAKHTTNAKSSHYFCPQIEEKRCPSSKSRLPPAASPLLQTEAPPARLFRPRSLPKNVCRA